MHEFKNSQNLNECDIFACMIHNLFDEYRFFHKYPDKELKIMGELFGAIISNKMIDGVVEKIALNFVSDALKRKQRMFKFGLNSLNKFKDRLFEWPQYVQTLLDIKSLK